MTKPFVLKSRNTGFWYVHIDGCYPMPDYHLTQPEAFRDAERLVGRRQRYKETQ